jgi:hypothetical protein
VSPVLSITESVIATVSEHVGDAAVLPPTREIGVLSGVAPDGGDGLEAWLRARRDER